MAKLTLRTSRAEYVARERARRVDVAARALDLLPARPRRASTMTEVFAAYVADLEAKRRPSVLDIRSSIACWLDPALGQLAPEECTPSRVARLVEAMTSSGAAANTVRTKVGFLRSALTCAVRLELVERHPCPSLRGVLPPKRTRAGFSSAAEVLTPAELVQIATSPRVPWVWASIWLVAGATGLRAAEVIALRRCDVDFGAPISPALHIRQQYSRKTRSFRLPKGGGPRVVALVASVAAWLEDWIARGYVALTGQTCGAEDLLFPETWGKKGLRPRNDRRVLKYWHKHLAALGLRKRRVHALRHSFVAMFLDAGVDAGLVQTFTHPAPAATPFDTYRHYSWAVRAEAAHMVCLELKPRSGQLELFQ